MTYAVIAEAVVILALIALVFAVVWACLRQLDRRSVAYEASLQKMADRVQAPERLPLSLPANFAIPELEEDDSAAVGTITYDERYGQEGEE